MNGYASDPASQRPKQRLAQARTVRMNPKVVIWVSFCAGMIALMSFSLLFLHAAFRNEWL